MNKVKCPYCGNSDMQVGFIGVHVAYINCVALSNQSRLTVSLPSGEVANIIDLLCPKCNNVFTVEASKDINRITASFPNLKVTNNSDRLTLLIVNNTLTPPYINWQTTIPPRGSINYTQSPDFYMAFVEHTDPTVTMENLTPNLIYEVSVFRSATGNYQEKTVLIPVGYYGDHSWTVNLNGRDGIRVLAYGMAGFLFKNDALSIDEFNKVKDIELPTAKDIPDLEKKLKKAIDKATKG